MRVWRIEILVVVALLCLLSVGSAVGQSRALSGRVVDSLSREPVVGAVVQLLEKESGTVERYTVTNGKGQFELHAPKGTQNRVLSVASMGYRKLTRAAEELSSNNIMELVSEPISISEVRVKAPDILMKGDTLIYDVSKFADTQDRTIADVLKKMPGIEVGESGEIKHQGKPINKLYIDGNDLLQGRYGIGTKNISHKDVEKVELMENHQPVRALKDIEHTDQAAINLKIKEDAKLRWAGSVEGGVGFSPLLLDGSLFAMRIAGKRQSMQTVKLNNTGWNPAAESRQFTFDPFFMELSTSPLPNHIAIGQGGAPLEEKRTRDNRSLLVNSVNQYKLGELYSLNNTLTYSGDRNQFSSWYHTDYFSEGIAPHYEENSYLSRRHDLSLKLVLDANTPSYFLKNSLTGEIGWLKGESTIGGTLNSHQRSRLPQYDFHNNLSLVKRIGHKTLRINSLNRFMRKPHTLLVENEGETFGQSVATRAFLSTTELGYGWKWRHWSLNTRGGAKIELRKMESNLTGLSELPFPLQNDLHTNLIKAYLNPSLIYEYGLLRATLSLPTSLNLYTHRDYQQSQKSDKTQIEFRPQLNFRYSLTAKLELFAGVSYGIKPNDIANFYSGAIMANYRHLMVGLPLYRDNKEWSANVMARYRNPLSSFFANLALHYQKGKSAPTYHQNFYESYIISNYQPISTNNEILALNGGLSKGLAGGKVTLKLEANYNVVNGESIINSLLTPYKTKSVSVTPSIKGTLLRWLALEYRHNYSYNHMKVENGNKSHFTNITQRLQVTLIPHHKLFVTLGAEHYYTQHGESGKNTLLLDADIRWQLSSKVELKLSSTNLLDQRNYRYNLFGTLSESTHSYKIRPRNVLFSAWIRF